MKQSLLLACFCPDLFTPLSSLATLLFVHLTVHVLRKTRRALIPESCFSHKISRPLQESFFFPSPARSARENSYIPWPHISACWHLPLHLCDFRLLLLNSWVDIVLLMLNSSSKLSASSRVYQRVKQLSALHLCSVSKNLKSLDSEERKETDVFLHLFNYLLCLLIVRGEVLYRRYCFLDKHLLQHSKFV